MPFILFEQREHPDITGLFPEIIREFSVAGSDQYFCTLALILALLAKIDRCLPKREIICNQNMIEIKPALNFIHQNFSKPIYQDYLSELCHMSLSSFRNKFKQTTGDKPLSYINKLRIQRSCALLKSSNKSIMDIASQVGYDSISTFNRQFTAIIGTSPSKWKALNEKKPPDERRGPV